MTPSSCALVALPLARLREAIDADARLRWAWIDMLAAETRRQRASVERLALRSVGARLLHYLATESEGAERGRRRDLAAELGVTHEALYRAIARFKSDGRVIEDASGILRLSRSPVRKDDRPER